MYTALWKWLVGCLGEGQGLLVSEEKVEPESTKAEVRSRISVRSKRQKFVVELQKLNWFSITEWYNCLI